jgi:hypothetical protein
MVKVKVGVGESGNGNGKVKVGDNVLPLNLLPYLAEAYSNGSVAKNISKDFEYFRTFKSGM